MEIDENMSQINKCQICDQEFDQMSIEVHIDIFHKQHKCEICERIFKTRITYKRHFNIVHENKGQYLYKNFSKSWKLENSCQDDT